MTLPSAFRALLTELSNGESLDPSGRTDIALPDSKLALNVISARFAPLCPFYPGKSSPGGFHQPSPEGDVNKDMRAGPFTVASKTA